MRHPRNLVLWSARRGLWTTPSVHIGFVDNLTRRFRDLGRLGVPREGGDQTPEINTRRVGPSSARNTEIEKA
ncbi:hypothetical protein Abr02nite_30900 [Paractinoplanes brasiliensis]|nr:hypothetical protein Abr02nite_30900 [Actinoplanes brasiliensis]